MPRGHPLPPMAPRNTGAHPGSVLLVIGGTGRHYPEIYKKVAALAEDASFYRMLRTCRSLFQMSE